ncbi:hypothetical protein CWATWH0402_562 [Crocosphaera watsonii WH 0402]|uniref:Uncharacterized protein n=1 Tax=Crocosphaera watsonii WH 0402 TaxID=1284629 RepID=T2JLS7_CROWT|nr:hypothetical protein CWATWH0402_562 [Crocosphaera watsonii WH 0402]
MIYVHIEEDFKEVPELLSLSSRLVKILETEDLLEESLPIRIFIKKIEGDFLAK